ncbi:MAG: RHS repeat protein, partial [Fimbriimonadia bacterium]
VGEGDIRQAQAVTIRSLEMVRDPAPPHWWSGSCEVESGIEISEEMISGTPPPAGFIFAESEIDVYPAEPGFIFPAIALPSGPGGGCECGILTIEPLGGTASAGGEFVVFTGTVPLRSQLQDDGEEGGPGDPVPTLFPPPFGNMSHWLSMRVEPGQALLDYWTPDTFSNDVDPAGRLGFVVVPARTTETGVGSPSASARAGILGSTTQGLTSLTDPDIGDFAVDATGARIRFGSYNGAQRVESDLNFVMGGSTITNAGPPGRIGSKGGWTYTFGLYAGLTDNVPIHLLTGITDPFGNEVSINHEQRTATFSWSGETWTWDLYTTQQGGPPGYLRMLERPGERFTFTWTLEGQMAGYIRETFDPVGQEWAQVQQYIFGWGGVPGALISARTLTDDCSTGCDAPQTVTQVAHSAAPFESQNEPHLVAFTDRFGYPKMQATTVGFEEAEFATNLTRYQSGRDYVVTATDPTGKTSTTRLRTATDVTGIPRVSEIHTEGATLSGAGRPSRTVVNLDQYDRATTVEWDTEAGALANGYELTYDGYSQRVASVTNSANDTWTVSWATAGGEPVVAAVTDPTSISWQFAYGQRGNPAAALTTMTSPWGAHWLFDYNGIGQLKQATAPDRASDLIEYYGEEQQDPAEYRSLPKRYTDPTGRSVYFEEYDLRKNLTQYSFEDDGYDKISTRFGYDLFGNLSTITHTDDSVASFTYGGGLLTKVTDEVGREVHFDRYPGGDNPGKLRCVAFDDGFQDRFAYLDYDDAGRLTRVWDGNKAEQHLAGETILEYSYGNAGELTAITHRNTGGTTSSEEFYYNAEGTLRARSTTDGHTIGYIYDQDREWLTGIDYPNDPDVAFTYDAAGRLEYVDDGPGAIDYVYDAYGRLWKAIRTFDALQNKQYVIEYFYNPDGTVQKTKSGLVAGGTDSRVESRYTLDDAGRLTKLEFVFPLSPPGGRTLLGFGTPNTWTWTYDRAGRLKTETDPTGVVTTYTYKAGDDKSFLEKVETKNGANTLMKFEYAPYSDASVASVTETIGGGANGTVSYEYDHRAQLETEQRVDSYQFYRGYNYDQAGNLTDLNLGGGETSAWTVEYNQLAMVDWNTLPDWWVTYGDDGAVSSLEVYQQGEWEYAYDDENRLTGVWYTPYGQATEQRYSCTYDAFGRPAVESFSPPGQQPVTRYLVWEGDELLMEVGPTGTVLVRHVWGAGGYQGYYRETSLTRLALRDGLGHVRGLMNTSKSITDRYVFDAYGNDVAPL